MSVVGTTNNELQTIKNMGRIFEVRKHTMFARWDRMAKQFTRIGKEIAIAVKSGGPDPSSNPALRRCFQNAKSVNMPKDRVEAAIKRAQGKEMANYEEILYEGYAPHGVAVLVETATDNPTRTVANVRSYFTKGSGNMGTSGSVSFQFKKMGVFKLKPEGLSQNDLELELIDAGLEEMGEGSGENNEPILVLRTAFGDFGNMQKALEEKKITPITAEVEWIPTVTVELPESQAEEVLKLVDKLEQDEDVQKVFHNLK
jgi:YebC/PmpR family DNA-binding regulatory protein